MRGGGIKNIRFNFWWGWRSSVNRTRRKVFQRARSAANEEATPTFSSSVNSKSLTEVSVSTLAQGSALRYASQSMLGCKALRAIRIAGDPTSVQGQDYGTLAD